MNRLNNLFTLAGNDGMKHIILSAVLTVVTKYLLPVFGSILDTYNKNKAEYWAKKDNAEYIEEYEDYNGFIMLDFVEYDTEDK